MQISRQGFQSPRTSIGNINARSASDLPISARRCDGTRDIDDLDVDGLQLPLESFTFLGPLPIVTFKEDLEANYLPQLAFIPRRGWERGIDRSDAANNLSIG